MNTELYITAQYTRDLYRAGAITREEAKERLKPYVEYYNETMLRLAAKYHQKPRPFSFNSFMR